MAIVYLLHFSRPYRHARHYLGMTTLALEDRLVRHRRGDGAKLLRAAAQAGVEFVVARLWTTRTPREARQLEIKLKRRGGGGRHCPICEIAKQINKK